MKHHTSILRICIFIIAILTSLSSKAALVDVADYNATVTASALNVRSGPSTNYRVIGTVYRNQSVRVTHRDGSWAKIVWSGGANAYISANYLSAQPPSTGNPDINVTDYDARVTASGLNVRSGPGTGHSIVGTVYQNQSVRVTHHAGVWRRIAWSGGIRAYVHGNYLQKVVSQPPVPAQATRYDDIGRMACHNCYEPQFAATIGNALDKVKSIEIDFWDQSFNSWGRPSGSQHGDWYVRHDLRGNANNNNCGGALSSCLRAVKAWSDNNRNADVVTVYLDKKQGWSAWNEGRTSWHLDNLINNIFGNRLYRPKDLKGGFASVRSAARNNAWKTRDQLKGKVMIVLTGGTTTNHNQTQHIYLNNRGIKANMFVAVDLDDFNDINGTPEHFSNATANHLVFYNLKENNFRQNWIDRIRTRNYVTRMWWSGGNDNGRDICSLLNKNIAHPAFYTKWNQNGNLVVDLNDRNNVCRRL